MILTIEDEIKGFINLMNEQLINTVDPEVYSCLRLSPIQDWYQKIYFIKRYFDDKYKYINYLIDGADDTECLTSGVRYIRETKKKIMENK